MFSSFTGGDQFDAIFSESDVDISALSTESTASALKSACFHYSRKAFTEALAVLDRVPGPWPDLVVIARYLTQLAIEPINADEFVAPLVALHQKGTSPLASYYLARHYHATCRYIEALTIMREALAADRVLSSRYQHRFAELTALCLTDQALCIPDPVVARKTLLNAVEADPNCCAALYNLAVITTDPVEASQLYLRVLEIDPNHVQALNNVAILRREVGHVEDAIVAFRRALKCLRDRHRDALLANDGTSSEFSRSIAMISRDLAHTLLSKEEEEAWLEAYQLAPDDYRVFQVKASMLHRQGEFAKELPTLGTAIALVDGNVNSRVKGALWAAKAECYRLLDDWADCKTAMVKAVDLDPSNKEYLHRLGAIYGVAGRDLEKSVNLCKISGEAEAFNTAGIFLRDIGLTRSAIASFEDCLKAEPDHRHASHSRLMSLNYLPQRDGGLWVAKEHRKWGESVVARVAKEVDSKTIFSAAVSRKNPAGSGKIRIGYVSPDLRGHSVSYFVDGLFRCHNPAKVEVYAYHDSAVNDAVTRRLRGYIERHSEWKWVDVHDMDDRQLARQIWEDHIDVLVDLAGHSGNNRLLVFAVKPAPCTVTYIGYPNTTGLPNMDFRLVDEVTDPIESSGNGYSEQLVRLPHCFLCYIPPENVPECVLEAPQRRTGGTATFGSFNTLAKLSDDTVRVWAQILREVPNSRLMLKSKALASTVAVERLNRLFAEEGVPSTRLDLLGMTPSTSTHLGMYGEIDVCLDPWPYAGTTTSAEAMFMGVPVVTLALKGACHSQRVTASLARAVGRDYEIATVATSEEEYIAKAKKLAENVGDLEKWRRELRRLMAEGPLCDAKKHTIEVEEAVEKMLAETRHSEGRENRPV
ncbi:o-linked n-acetylglucosamine transferase, ogt, putative [Perkinsus marinus ATCC 50983]|uniref:protein O-GlcNAc transferase n=1 Tax=Perkinsus marinus (strain ATCC 50983 / TXsc) TaxID=423536 RepID=C5KTY5_PERM5|nr:o-linked n-acetylglucosamine transferase, ogt, putative [Perkinsus marinus ATCC 50983]EER12027.1 o-linked n-acetylglucosamine transferase, ogt, putative [Perkinsus marinus ATCC 50983]|eukprot:XP_002780232.1 o-linked n-acetylglucosamine transferase, ogt, putative [Perkinsus marinus ATCC 50983]